MATVARSDVSSVSSYGTPGLVEVPAAEAFDDGVLAFGVAYSDLTLRNSVTFQVLPYLQGTFRYSVTEDYGPDSPLFGGALYDRSFDVQLSVLGEGEVRPAVAVGLRDFLGTGVLSGEYVVLTKGFTDGITVSGGIGWGRFAGRNSFDNPLSFLGFDSEFRDNSLDSTGGRVDAGRWFQGEAALFGGVNWQVNDQFSVQLEYSPDVYRAESAFGDTSIESPINAAVAYHFASGVDAKVFLIGGKYAGVQLNYDFDPRARLIPGGREPSPLPIAPRASLTAASWNVGETTATSDVLRARLMAEGLALAAEVRSATAASITVENNRWGVEAQAAGRAARVMANTLPPQIEEFTVVFQERGVPISSVTTHRRDLEDLQYDYDSAWRTEARALIDDAMVTGVGAPRLDYQFGPYAALSFFDPQSPIRADFGAQFAASYQAAPGLTFDALLRYPLAGNFDEAERASDSVIRRVRSESYLYAKESDLEVNRLTAEYMWRPAPDTFARVTGGYLENQFGGVSTELLWSPIDSRFALGAEVNYVKQRGFDMRLGFQDYDVVTGHASAYYDLGNGFHTQVDLGRYLAGDWGGTLTVKREFNNGVKMGGYFTLTDVSFDDFGEGAFDKGLMFEMPLSFFTGQPSRRVVSQTIQPILRDGGARLQVENRLYPLVRDYRGPELRDGWARYLR